MTLSATATINSAGTGSAYQLLAWRIGSGSWTYWFSGTGGASTTTYTASVPSGTDISTVQVMAESQTATNAGSVYVSGLSIR